MVEGAIATVLAGMLGGLIAETIRVARALIEDRQPTGRQLLASFLQVALGAGVVLYGTAPRSLLEAATLGAAFPLLFASAVNAVTPQAPAGDSDDRIAGPSRSAVGSWRGWLVRP